MEDRDLWTLDPNVITGLDPKGFSVSAVDGDVGKVEAARYAPGSSHLVVSTGRFFGRDVLVPAGLVTRIDVSAKSLHVAPTKDEIRDLPGADRGLDDSARGELERLAERLPTPEQP